LVNQLALTTLKPVSNSLDTRRLSLVVIRTTARLKGDLLKPHWDVLAPSVFSCVRDVIIPIKLAAEKAFLALFTLADDVERKELDALLMLRTVSVTELKMGVRFAVLSVLMSSSIGYCKISQLAQAYDLCGFSLPVIVSEV
jgi:hypothetical protein